tara:strand:- start:1892 stop:3454 length:1563 start_codon:yes stop_codon:yes gene_type:complete
MFTFVLIQEAENQVHEFFSSINQIDISNPGNNIICACTSDIYSKISSYPLKNSKLSHFEIQNDGSLKTVTKNWLSLMKYAVEKYEKVIYITPNLILVNKIPLDDELIKQQIAFVKLRKEIDTNSNGNNNVIITENEHPNKKTSYLAGLLYLSNIHAVNCIEKHFCKNISSFNDEDGNVELDENSDNKKETRNLYIESWKNIPYVFADKDDGIIGCDKYISYKGIVTTADFFTASGSYKIADVSVKDDVLKHKDDVIWGMIIHVKKLLPVIQQVNTHLTSQIISYNVDYLNLINLLYSRKGVQTIVPRKDGILHWNRENSKFYNFLKDICDSSFLLGYRENLEGDYFYLNNFILYDKPSVKFITNVISSCFKIIYFNYDDELLEFFETYRKPTIFAGYYSPYPKILEAFIEPQDVTREGTKTLKELDYSNEEDFKLYLNDLSTYKYFNIDKNTPKTRIAECLRLGVVPRLVDETKLLEINDIAKDNETDWEILSEKCREYYSNNLSSHVIADKLVKIIFNM